MHIPGVNLPDRAASVPGHAASETQREPAKGTACHNPGQERCPACGWAPLTRVHVHGHSQCSRCGVNIEPCCQPS